MVTLYINLTNPIQCVFLQINVRGGNLAVRHPVLGVAICQRCLAFYASGEWTKDEDGCDQFCRWCAQVRE